MNFLPIGRDFQDDIGLGGGLGDIPDNLVGSTNCDLRIDEQNADEELSLGLSEMFAARLDRNIHLVPNDERLAGIYDTGLEAQREKRVSDALKMAKLQATTGKNAMEIFQSLKKELTDDEIRSLPGIRDLLNAPFIWALVIDDPSAFDSCDQARSMLRSLEGKRKPLGVLSTQKCLGCTNNENGLCRKLGKKLVNGLDFTPEMFGEISDSLRMQGVIQTDGSVKSINEIKVALSPKKSNPVRVYNAPKKVKASAISREDAVAELHSFSVKKAEEENQNQRDSITDDAKLIAQKLLPLIYKDASIIEIQHVEATLFSPERKKTLHDLHKLLNEDPLIKSGLAFPRIIFDSCKQAKSFMGDNGIKVGYIKAIAQCDDCKNNLEGCCHLLGGALLTKNARVTEHDRFAAIDNACGNAGEAKKFKGIERKKYLAGLRQALQMNGRIPTRTSSLNVPRMNSEIDLTDQFIDKSNALKSAIDKLSSGFPISSVRTMLQSQLGNSAADSIIEDAIFSMPVINANVLDNCICAGHQYRQGAVIVKSSKCSICQYASEGDCLKTKLPFGIGELPRIGEAEQTPEAREIIDMFHNPERVIDAEPYSQVTGIQIEMNPDSGNEYDLGRLVKTELPDMSVPDMVIDVNPMTSTKQGLEIEDLGSADGWDIGGCL